MDCRWAIAVVLWWGTGCAPTPAGEGDSSSSGAASTEEGSTGVDSTSVDSSSSGEDTTTLVQCPGGEVSALWDVTLPSPPPDTEAGEFEFHAMCTIAAPATQIGEEWTLGLTCDEVDGAAAQPVTITVESVDSPFPTLDDEAPLQLDHARWWAFEFGSGWQLSLVQDGTTRLLAFGEAADNGEGGGGSLCSAPGDDLRVTANEWLAPIGGRVEPAGCDPESQFRIVRTANGGDTYAYPGAITSLGELQAAVEDASCTSYEFGNEGWALRFVIWAD